MKECLLSSLLVGYSDELDESAISLDDARRTLSNIFSNIGTDTLPNIMSTISTCTEIDLESPEDDDGTITMIPDCIIELKSIQDLNLSWNSLETRISENLWNLTTLTRLDMRNCELESLPEAIGNLINLNYLHFGNNRLTSLPNALCNLKGLKTLYLHSNQLTVLPAALGNLSNLENLKY